MVDAACCCYHQAPQAHWELTGCDTEKARTWNCTFSAASSNQLFCGSCPQSLLFPSFRALSVN